MKIFILIALVFLGSKSLLAASMVYPSKDLAIISKEDLENARKYPDELRARSKKITENYLKAYNAEFKKLNKIEVDVISKKVEDMVMLNFENMTNIQLLTNAQSDMLKIRDWLDYEAYQIYNKYYLTSKKAYEFNLANPSPNPSSNPSSSHSPVRYDSQISELNLKIKELSDRFSRVLDKAEQLESQNKVLKNEIEINQKKIDSLQTNIDSNSARPVVVPAAVETNKNQSTVYIVFGAMVALAFIYLFGRRGKN